VYPPIFCKRSGSPLNKNRASAHLLFTLILALSLAVSPALSEETTPETLSLTVYSDGFVSVDYTIQVDPTYPTQNITVFGQILEDLLVLDNEGLPLDYSLSDSTLTVYSLGADKIKLTYLTQDLTSKDGRYWTLSIVAPIPTRIILPVECTIISLNKVPETIETSNDRVELLMNSTLIEVTYVIGVVGTKEHAQIVLNEATSTINEIKNLGIKLSEAEVKLQQANSAFNSGNYVDAETLGSEAKSLAIQINQTAAQANSKMDEAEAAIATAQTEGRTVGLDAAQNLLEQANNEYSAGNYAEALSLAEQSLTAAGEATTVRSDGSESSQLDSGSQSESGEDIWTVYGIVGAIGLPVVIVLGLFLRSRRKVEVASVEKKRRRIDVERIFRANKDLLPEEQEAIKFLAERDGEAFEAELYDHIKLPRTTTWRLVKRLEGMGIIKRSKFRRQNLIRIKRKYDLKE